MLSPNQTNIFDPSLDGGSSTMGQPREIKIEMSTNRKPDFEVIGHSKNQSDMSLDGINKGIGISPGKYTQFSRLNHNGL
jgi:hypothetical protein